jgi:hypothetical protein
MYKDVLVSMHVMATCLLLILAVQLKELLVRILLQ